MFTCTVLQNAFFFSFSLWLIFFMFESSFLFLLLLTESPLIRVHFAQIFFFPLSLSCFIASSADVTSLTCTGGAVRVCRDKGVAVALVLWWLPAFLKDALKSKGELHNFSKWTGKGLFKKKKKKSRRLQSTVLKKYYCGLNRDRRGGGTFIIH